MTRRILALLLSLPVLFAACSSAKTVVTLTTSTTTTSTTTTLPPTTTTTTTPVSVKGAPDGLTALVDGFYAYATGESKKAPQAPKPVLTAIKPAEVDTPKKGSASIGTFKGHHLSVVEMDKDVFLALKEKGKPWRIVGGKWPSISVRAYYGKGPRLIAVVGSDARPNEKMDETRADSIHFVGLDGKGAASVVGLPRDSYVPVPGHWTTKITESLAMGGPETMMATFDELTDLPLEGYVLTGFAGFEELSGTVLGGIEVEVPFAINDRWAHVALEAGKQMLDGAQALGFARARKTVPNGDFTRSEHQGVILVSAAKMVRAMGMSAIPGLLEASEPHLMTDLTPEQLFTFSAMAISAKLGETANVVAPGRPGSAGSASVVYLSGSAADLWADLADGRLDS